MRPVILVTMLAVLHAGCAGDSGSSSPTSPTPSPVAAVATPPLSVQSISSVPDGAGIQYNTDFQLTAVGSFPAGTEFVWNFGDGSSTTTSLPTVGRTYGQAGVFAVNVTARHAGETSSVARQVSVRSMVGRWFGKMTGFTHFPPQRPVAITSFELMVIDQTPDGDTLMLRGRWADDAGCRETRPEFMRERIQPSPTTNITFGINQYFCADGDLYLSGTADVTFDNIEGHCNGAGNNPNCRFTMTRQ